MPNATTHKKLGAALGAIAVVHCAQDESPRDRAVEVLGGLCGGFVGGLLPDRLDPPLSPRHRAEFHSLMLLLLLMTLTLEATRLECRRRAQQCLACEPSGSEAMLRSDLWRFAAGFITGLQWGYVSHLSADLTTKAGLPLIARGC